MKTRFDKGGVCRKCNQRVARATKGGTWHHVNIEDYRQCGYVDIERDEDSTGKKKINIIGVNGMESIIEYFDKLMLKKEFPLTLRDNILEAIFKYYDYNDSQLPSKKKEVKNNGN